jgi:hypothetical protein
MTYGKSALVLEAAGPGEARLAVDDSGTSISWPSAVTYPFAVPNSQTHRVFRISVTTDPNLKSIIITRNGTTLLSHYLAGDGPAATSETEPSSQSVPPVVSVTNLSSREKSSRSLCEALSQSR